ncbi:MAG: DUF501 domain-containing protein [Phycisphaerae bacterium]|nr:DUF501 domain-containing protein [Tepidisphaeraceae bacterium]
MIAPEDSTFVAGLGLRGVVRVAARCPGGHSAVVECYPLRRRGRRAAEPFPTLYWLVCPVLDRAVAQLERDGAVAEVDALLARDAEMTAGLRRAHEEYADRRWAALTDEDRAWVEANGLAGAFRGRGVAGIAFGDGESGVKCLHAHFAHHLVSGNPVGAWVERRFGVRPCT